MEQRERRNEDAGAGGSPSPGSGGNLNRLRQQGNDFLAAGDDAINRSLSGDSEAFIAANRQQGGE